MTLSEVKETNFANGIAKFGPGNNVSEWGHVVFLARYWARLAYQAGQAPDFGEILPNGLADLASWARAVLDLARAVEGSNAPQARVELTEDGSQLVLSWTGTWTEGRFVRVKFRQVEAPISRSVPVTAELEWDSATGKPSTFLGIEQLLESLGQ